MRAGGSDSGQNEGPTLPKEDRPGSSAMGDPARLAAADRATLEADLHLEGALVVLQVAVVDAEEQLARGRHLHAIAAADQERRPVADLANERAGRSCRHRRVRRTRAGAHAVSV